MMSLYRCALGDHPMPDHAPRYQKVEGWERPGRGLHNRSGSSLVLRKTHPVFACAGCIAAAQAGIDPGQLAMEEAT